MPHWPPEHRAVPLAMAGQAWPQPPQWATLVFTSISQPSLKTLLQSPLPAAHEATAQAPPAPPAVALAGFWHTRPQPPQLATSLPELISQPLPGLASQSR